MKIDNINEKLVKKRNRFVVIKNIVKTKNIIKILDNMKFAKENTGVFLDNTTGVTINTKCRYIGCINGEDLFEWNEKYSCRGNIFSNKCYITDKDKNIINMEENKNRKLR